MKAIRIHAFGGAEQLRLEEVEKPQPKADEVLIKNMAAGINYADIMLRNGEYLRDPQLPTIPGFEVPEGKEREALALWDRAAEWEAVPLYEAALNREEYRKLAERFGDVARYSPGLYEVVST